MLYFILGDRRTPQFVSFLILGAFFYALSPIDLVPDLIPGLGLVDDMALVPMALLLALRSTPEHILVSARMKASQLGNWSRRAWQIVTLFLLLIALVALFILLSWAYSSSLSL